MDFRMGEAAETASTIDPLFALLIGALGASLLTVIGGLVGAGIQSVRDHRKWLREKRLEAYFDFMVDMSRLTDMVTTNVTPENKEDVLSRMGELYARIDRSSEAVSILGPRKVNQAGQDWVGALTTLSGDKSDANKKSVRTGRWAFLRAAGKVLRSKNVGKNPPTARPLPRS